MAIYGQYWTFTVNSSYFQKITAEGRNSCLLPYKADL